MKKRVRHASQACASAEDYPRAFAASSGDTNGVGKRSRLSDTSNVSKLTDSKPVITELNPIRTKLKGMLTGKIDSLQTGDTVTTLTQSLIGTLLGSTGPWACPSSLQTAANILVSAVREVQTQVSTNTETEPETIVLHLVECLKTSYLDRLSEAVLKEALESVKKVRVKNLDPVKLWRSKLRAKGIRVSEQRLRRIARGSAESARVR